MSIKKRKKKQELKKQHFLYAKKVNYLEKKKKKKWPVDFVDFYDIIITSFVKVTCLFYNLKREITEGFQYLILFLQLL